MALTDNLIGTWHFNTDGLDSSGNGNDLVLSGAVINTDDQLLGGGCLGCDGVDDDATVTLDSATVYDNDGSWSFWMNPTTLNKFVILMGTATSVSLSEHRIRTDTDNYLYFQIRDAGGTFHTIKSSITLSMLTWYHIVATWSNANGMRLYIDASTANGGTDAHTGTSRGTTVLTIGGGFFTSDWTFDGLIDEGNMHGKELTQAEVDEMYNGGVGIEVGALGLSRGRLINTAHISGPLNKGHLINNGGV